MAIEEGKSYLSDLWYFGAMSDEVKPGQHLHKELLGQPLLIGRTHDGEAFALRDICPHRGILLSGGEMVREAGQSAIECPYHGWRFGRDGGCLKIPSLTGEQTERMDLSKIKTRAFPVREAQGLIWVWHGADETVEPFMDPVHIDLTDGRKPRFWQRDVFNCHVDHAVIGLMDPAHIPYIHRQWWWRTAKSVHDKSKEFGPVERGFSMLPHTPSSNSFLYKLLGAKPETEIRFQLPGVRQEYVRVGDKSVVGFTAVTPTNDNKTEITIALYWTHPVLDIVPNFILKNAISTFVGQDRDAVNAQQVGLAYDPNLMLIHDADVQAKWYYRLKQAWADARAKGEEFVNPVKPATLKWRS